MNLGTLANKYNIPIEEILYSRNIVLPQIIHLIYVLLLLIVYELGRGFGKVGSNSFTSSSSGRVVCSLFPKVVSIVT